MTPVEEIKSKLSVESVIGEVVSLRQAGTNLKALCPFHQERTPSFMVSPDKQIWHCFGCNEGGDLFMFVQKFEGVEFRDAVRMLAERAGVALRGFSMPEYREKSVLYDINAAAADEYADHLRSDRDDARKTRAYLSSRGLSENSIRDWHLGLAGDSWDAIGSALGTRGYAAQDLITAGLMVARDGKTYDRFRRRLMFPIRDGAGRTVGFTARTLARIVYQDEDLGGKYINSPQTPVYNKSQILYGFDRAKHAVRRQDYVIIVEGNMDVIMSHQADVRNVVAASGTALTLEQLRLIKRHTENLILAFDADAAGSHAVFRGISLAWELGMNVKVIVLSGGKDPADVIAQNPELWRESIRSSVGVVDYYFDQVFARVDLKRADHKKKAAEKICGILSRLSSSVEQAHYIGLLSRRLSIGENFLWPLIRASGESPRQPAPAPDSHRRPRAHVSEHLLGFLAVYSDFIPRVIDEVEPDMVSASARDLYKKIIIHYTKERTTDVKALVGSLTQEELKLWSELAFHGEEFFKDLKAAEQERELRTLIRRTKEESIKSILQDLTGSIKEAERMGDAATVDTLLREYQALSKKRSALQV